MRIASVAVLVVLSVAGCSGGEFRRDASEQPDASMGGAGAAGSGGSAASASGGSATGGSGGAAGGAATGGAGGALSCIEAFECDDGDVCNGTEACVAGRCAPGEPLVCEDDGNPCTTTECHPTAGCVHTPNQELCDDGDPCSVEDRCGNAVCKGAPKQCGSNEVCAPNSGNCVCKSGTIRCDNSCVAFACCPGTTAGACGRCGTSTCRNDGSGWDCLDQSGNCDPGWSCQGDACVCEGNPCACPAGQRRECHDCVISGCY